MTGLILRAISSRKKRLENYGQQNNPSPTKAVDQKMLLSESSVPTEKTDSSILKEIQFLCTGS